ncbi:MAG: hypothetical protein LBS01_04970 [Prevotellaceae bacterium]|jgi:hypothetical protein|nr:hypothetical protein [Prevotellaceae bacterium]
MMIIQNLTCIQLTLSPDSHRCYFNDSAYSGKKVTGIFFYQGNGYSASPLYKDPARILELPASLHFYLTLADKAGNLRVQNFVSDYQIKNFADGQRPGFIPLNFEINPDLSYIEYQVEQTVNLLMCVIYETAPVEHVSRTDINGVKTFSAIFEKQTDNTYIVDKKLSEITGNFLKGKRVKDIRVRGSNSAFHNIYVWLITDKFFIENMYIQSGALLPKEETMFQNLKIDAEKSLIKMRYIGDTNLPEDPFGDGSIKLDLTFYY